MERKIVNKSKIKNKKRLNEKVRPNVVSGSVREELHEFMSGLYKVIAAIVYFKEKA